MAEIDKIIIFAKEFRRGQTSPPYFWINAITVINKTELEKFIESKLTDTSYFLVETKVSKDNEIKIEIDSMQSVDIDFCINLSREIEEAFPREEEDYELEVGSAGITSPFKVHQQFIKNIGKEVEVQTKTGKKLTGLLLEAGEKEFKIRTEVKFKPEGKKKYETKEEEMTFGYDEVNSVKYLLKF